MYCLQDPQPGALYLLLSPGRPRVTRHVDRVQGGAGVGVRRRGEDGKLYIASRELGLFEWNGGRGGWKGFSILYLTDLKNRNNIRSDMLDSATILDITNNLLAEPIYI